MKFFSWLRRHAIAAGAAFAVASAAIAGGYSGLTLSGSVTAGHIAIWASPGVLQDGGAPSAGSVTNVATAYPNCGGPIVTTGTVSSCGPTSSGRLTNVDTTTCKFGPYNGDIIRIAGTVYQIPYAGIAGCATTNIWLNGASGQNLAASTFYYVYAFSYSGTLTVEFSTVGYVIDTTAGNVGTEIESGAPSLSLIGAVYVDASNHFQDADATRYTLSWFNRQPKRLLNAFTATRQTASTSMAEVNAEIETKFIAWADDPPSIGYSGYVTNLTANDGVITAIGRGGCSTLLAPTYAAIALGGASNTPAGGAIAPIIDTGLTEAQLNYYTVCGQVAAGTGSWQKATTISGDGFPSLVGQLRG